MTIHKLKFKGEALCDAVYEGRKPFEIRFNDRNYEVGDLIYPIPLDNDLNPIEHPIAKCIYKITFVIKDTPELAPGYCVFGIERIR